MNKTELTDFATRYAAAWSSQKPANLAAFYEEDGSLRVNAGAPAVGRAAITAKAQDFMTAFPDMVVKLDKIRGDGKPRNVPLDLDRHEYGSRRHGQGGPDRGIRGMDPGRPWPDRGIEGALR